MSPKQGRPALGALQSYPSELRDKVYELRDNNPGWGAISILVELEHVLNYSPKNLPSADSVYRYLKYCGFINPKIPKSDIPEVKPPVVKYCHDLWEMDAQGAVPVYGFKFADIVPKIKNMKTHKILNDPVYGFVQVPYGVIFDLLEHPYFQRLRRIKQLSLTHYVYPGALHTRFHHALGALHLMMQTITVLRSKGVNINKKEAEAVNIAILLHDIGHGPFSHTLEHTLIKVHHEELSVLFMEKLNEEFGGQLSMAIQIFKGEHPKTFLTQLVSSQLDMDRMDYLNRDSYFTGVSEGVIGYDRLIKMLAVHDGELVVEEKGLYSIERFLTARRLMYWQVYLHKTVLSAEIMLVQIMKRAKDLMEIGEELPATTPLRYFLNNRNLDKTDFKSRPKELLDAFARLDDTDIAASVKEWTEHSDPILSYLSNGLANRKLFRLEFNTHPFTEDYKRKILKKIKQLPNLPKKDLNYFFINGKETNTAYSASKDEISILLKTGATCPMSEMSDSAIQPKVFEKHYLWYPKV